MIAPFLLLFHNIKVEFQLLQTWYLQCIYKHASAVTSGGQHTQKEVVLLIKGLLYSKTSISLARRWVKLAQN